MPPPKTPDPLFRVVSKLKNNRLVAAREARGMNAAQAARAIGVEPTLLGAFENFKQTARLKDGRWSVPATRIAAFYGIPPDELWPEAVNAVRRTESVQLLREEDILYLEPPETPLAALEASEEARLVRVALSALAGENVRLATVVRRHSEDGADFQVIGDELGVTRTRAHQMYAQGVRRMRAYIERKTKGT